MKISLKPLFLPVSKMDSIWFKRLSGYVKEGLGDVAITIEALSHITILVMEFVDSFATTLAQPMDATEKHFLAVSWIDQFVEDGRLGRVYRDGGAAVADFEGRGDRQKLPLRRLLHDARPRQRLDKRQAAAIHPRHFRPASTI